MVPPAKFFISVVCASDGLPSNEVIHDLHGLVEFIIERLYMRGHTNLIISCSHTLHYRNTHVSVYVGAPKKK